MTVLVGSEWLLGLAFLTLTAATTAFGVPGVLVPISFSSGALLGWEGTLAVTGPYGHVRHPQYVGFIAIMFGFLLQWPTLVTLAMFPILVTVYVRLARREEGEVRAEFGPKWDAYAARTPAFVPHRWRSGRTAGGARDVRA